MNILLLGYGKMGRAIETVLLDRGHHVAARIDKDNRADLATLPKDAVDVVIEFSSPDAAADNVRAALQRGWAVVSGTTGWEAERRNVAAAVATLGGAFFWASNYSIGVNLFFRLNKVLARFMKNYPSYGVSMEEVHHVHKKDAPSGTAVTLAEGVLEHFPEKSGWALREDVAAENATGSAPAYRPVRSPAETTLPITSRREGEVPGTHVVRYVSDVDTIEISHVAHSRAGFALGAVLAAEWLVGRSGTFGMDDLLGEL